MTTQSTTDHATLGEHKDTLVKDVKEMVGDADQLLREVGRSTVEQLHAARLAALEQARRLGGAGCEYARANPWQMVGLAAALGLIVGALLSRR